MELTVSYTDGMEPNKRGTDCVCKGSNIASFSKTYCTPDCGDHGDWSMSQGKCKCDKNYVDVNNVSRAARRSVGPC